MLNELYTFAEPVQVVPFSNLKWGKFTLLHTATRTLTPLQSSNSDISDSTGVWAIRVNEQAVKARIMVKNLIILQI